MNTRRVSMKPVISIAIIMACAFLAAACAGCYMGQEKYERTELIQAPLEPTGRVSAETHNGGITVGGGEEPTCRITARITGYAPEVEQAQRLAEQTQVRLVPRNGGLATQIDRPNVPNRCGLSVDFEITVPRRTNLDLLSHNGAIRVFDIASDVSAKSHNGEMRAERLAGNVNLETHNGRVWVEGVMGRADLESYNGEITCRGVVGPLNATTRNGNVEVVYGEGAGPAPNSRVVTYNGSIEFVAPANLSAKTRIQTHNGSVRTAIPIVVEGEIDKNRISGTSGAGEGMVDLETYNGSISLR